MNGADWGELIGIVILVLVVFVMAASETAIVRVGRARAYRLAEEDRRGSQSLLKIVENIAPYLNVVLLVTLVATLLCRTGVPLTRREPPLHAVGWWIVGSPSVSARRDLIEWCLARARRPHPDR